MQKFFRALTTAAIVSLGLSSDAYPDSARTLKPSRPIELERLVVRMAKFRAKERPPLGMTYSKSSAKADVRVRGEKVRYGYWELTADEENGHRIEIQLWDLPDDAYDLENEIEAYLTQSAFFSLELSGCIGTRQRIFQLRTPSDSTERWLSIERDPGGSAPNSGAMMISIWTKNPLGTTQPVDCPKTP